MLSFGSRPGSVNRQVELMTADDKGRLHIRLYMKDTLTGERICLNDKLVDKRYGTHVCEPPRSQPGSRVAVDVVGCGIQASTTLPLTTGEGSNNSNADLVNTNKSPMSSVMFDRGTAMNVAVEMSPGLIDRQGDSLMLVTSPRSTTLQKSPHLVPPLPPVATQVNKHHKPLRPDMPAVSPIAKGRGLALLQGLRNVGTYTKGVVNSQDAALTNPLNGIRSPPSASIHNSERQSADDMVSPEHEVDVTLNDTAPGSGQRAVKMPSSRLPTHFLAAQQKGAFSTLHQVSGNEIHSPPAGSIYNSERRTVNPVVATHERSDATLIDRAPDSAQGAVKTHRARLPTHFLAAQQKGAFSALPQGSRNVPSPTTKVRFSDSDDVQSR